MIIPLIQTNSQTSPPWATQPAWWVFLAALFGLAFTAFSQPTPGIASPPVAPATATATVKLTDTELQTLLAQQQSRG